MANFTALAAARHELLRRAGWDVEADGLHGAPRLRVIVGDEVHVSVHRRASAARASARGRSIRVDGRRPGPHAAGRARAPRWRGGAADVPTIVCAQAGNVNTGAFDPLDAIADDRAPPRRVAARRRRVRPVGRGERGAAASRARRRARRFVGDRRAQVAERAVRLRARLRRAPGGASRGDEPQRRVSGAFAGRAARADGLDAGVVAPRARLRGLRRAAIARPQRRRRSRRSLLPPRAPVRRSAARRSRRFEILNDVVLNQVLVRVVPADGRRRRRDARGAARACRTSASAGWAARAGTAWTRCGSRSRTGRRPRRTSIDRRTR